MIPTIDPYNDEILKRELKAIVNRICENRTFTRVDAARIFQIADGCSPAYAQTYVDRHWVVAEPQVHARNIEQGIEPVSENLQQQILDLKRLVEHIMNIELPRLDRTQTDHSGSIDNLIGRVDSILGIMESVQDTETVDVANAIFTNCILTTSSNLFPLTSNPPNAEPATTDANPSFTYEIPDTGQVRPTTRRRNNRMNTEQLPNSEEQARQREAMRRELEQQTAPSRAQPSPDTGEGSASSFLNSIYGETIADHIGVRRRS